MAPPYNCKLLTKVLDHSTLKALTLSLLMMTQEAFVDCVDQDRDQDF